MIWGWGARLRDLVGLRVVLLYDATNPGGRVFSAGTEFDVFAIENALLILSQGDPPVVELTGCAHGAVNLAAGVGAPEHWENSPA